MHSRSNCWKGNSLVLEFWFGRSCFLVLLGVSDFQQNDEQNILSHLGIFILFIFFHSSFSLFSAELGSDVPLFGWCFSCRCCLVDSVSGVDSFRDCIVVLSYVQLPTHSISPCLSRSFSCSFVLLPLFIPSFPHFDLSAGSFYWWCDFLLSYLLTLFLLVVVVHRHHHHRHYRSRHHV